ncbi:hypothetical protein pb186bvf_017999 [Paramecium bursaria]
MFYKQYNDQEEVPQQERYTNKASNTGAEQESQQVKVGNQNYNYPQIQQQQLFELSNTQIVNPQNYNQQQGNLQPQLPIVAPENADINENSQLSHTGQKRAFTLSIVILWIVQMLMELLCVLKFKTIEKWKIYPCFFISLIIQIYTVKKNHPTNLMSVSFMDKLLFIIYFVADIFTVIAIVLLNFPALNFFLLVFRINQFGNLICSMFTLVYSSSQIQRRRIIITTITPFVFVVLYVSLVWPIWEFYLIPISWQISQFILTFNLIRVINEQTQITFTQGSFYLNTAITFHFEFYHIKYIKYYYQHNGLILDILYKRIITKQSD